MAFARLIALESCRIGGGTFIEAGGLELAVFRLADPDRVIVIDNACPHSSGNLSAGEVADGIVTCPLHHWKFDLERGICTHSELARVRRYAAEIRPDGCVWADLSGG
jgi:nitrite reductase (NADH) small subunit